MDSHFFRELQSSMGFMPTGCSGKTFPEKRSRKILSKRWRDDVNSYNGEVWQWTGYVWLKKAGGYVHHRKHNNL